MKNIKILLAICIACIACEKKDDGSGYKLVSHFTLDSTLSDKNNYSSDGWLNTSGQFTPNGKVGSCINLSIDEEFDLGTNLFYNFKSEYRKLKTYSVSFWFKINDMTGTESKTFFISRSVDVYNNPYLDAEYFLLKIKNDSLIIGKPRDIPENPIIPIILEKDKSTTLNPFNWNNIIMIFNNNDIKLYLNGNLVYTVERINSQYLYLNLLSFGNMLTGRLNMRLDDVHVYNYPISESEVINYYNSTK